MIRAALPFIQENRCTELLILVPSNLKADELREAILDRPEVKGFIGLRINTFFDVTQEIFHASGHTGRIRSPMARRWAVQRLITSLQLPVLQGIQQSRGLTDLAVDLIGALKDGDVSPQAFMRSADFPGAPPFLGEMARIFQAYESEREREQLLDREDLFGLSAQVLPSPDAPVFAGLRQVLVTGFYDFTPLQLKLLAALGSLRRMEAMELTLLHPEGNGPAQRFIKRTLERIGHVFPRAQVIPFPKPSDGDFTPLDHLRRHILTDQEETTAVAGDDSISVMHAAGTYREVEETVRRIRRLILDGGRTFKDFALVFRDLNRYQETVREVFRLYQIPHRMASGFPLRHNPLVQSVMALLEVPRSNFGREAVIRFLRSDYLELKQPPEGAVSAERFDTLSREAMIHGGGAQWTAQFKNRITLLERRLQYLEEETPEDRETVNEKTRIYRKKVADYRGCMALMGNLMEAVKPIPKQGTVGRFVDVVSDLITDLHGEQAIYAVGDPRLIRRDQQGLRRLDELLSELKAEHQGPAHKISLSQFIQLLGETLAETTYGPDRTEEDAVLVIDALGMRELHRPVVFVGGLVEESFPRTHMAGPFLGDEARDRINRAMGPDRWLSRSADWRDEEELLFLLAAASATERLCLTYPRTDSQGRDLLPSRYVEKVLSLFSEGTLHSAAISLSDPLPDRHLIFRQTELLEYTFLHLAQEPGLELDTPLLYNHLLHHQREKVDALRHSLTVVQARKDHIGPYVGRPGSSVADRIRRDETTYSASALEIYG
ncbi:MAG: 3'-5' exonuclease, partial [bacterium]|nr:3'-5' exonuclease [bacterium]